MSKKLCWLALSGSIVLTGCNSAGSNNTASQVASLEKNVLTQGNSSQSLYHLGGTYDTMSNHPTSTISCLNITNDPNKVMILNPHAGLEFTQKQSLQQVLRASGVNFHLHIDLGITSFDMAYKYAKSSQSDDYNLNINYIYQYSGIATFKENSLLTGEAELTPEASQMLHTSPQTFRQMCGDNFIGQADAGASVLINLKLHFDSSVDKNYYDDNLRKIGGLQNVLGVIKNNPGGVNYSLTASGLQVGGSPELLNQLFVRYGGTVNADGYPELNCGNSIQTNSNCSELVNQVISYATSLKDQLHTPSDYYFTNPILSSWPSIGVYPGSVAINPKITQAMQDLNKHYQTDYADNEFINNYYNMLSSKGMLSQDFGASLSQLITKYKNLMMLYKNPDYHLNDCFNGFVSLSCINIHDNFLRARAAVLNDNRLNQLLNYIKTNQYQANLFIDSYLKTYSLCLLSPISNENNPSFMVNCNGQVSRGTPEAPITLQKTNDAKNVQINNLVYRYKNSDGLTSFTYSFIQPLTQDSFYGDVYAGDPLIKALSAGFTQQIRENVLFGNYF